MRWRYMRRAACVVFGVLGATALAVGILLQAGGGFFALGIPAMAAVGVGTVLYRRLRKFYCCPACEGELDVLGLRPRECRSCGAGLGD
jgi:hypothetical protein